MKNFKNSLLFALAFMSSTLTFAQNPQSANVIKFGGDDNNTLFLGDLKSTTIFAYTIPNTPNPDAQKGYNIENLGYQISKLNHTTVDNIIVRDMAVNPVSKEAYISVDVKTKTGYTSTVVIANQSGSLRNFDLVNTKHTAIKVDNAPTSEINFYDKTSLRSFTFTDIDYFKGKLYISGMSNAEFSSALRVLDYPFNNSKVATASVEFFHGVHNQTESRAPILTMQIVSLNAEDYIVAAYTCTPLVLIPLKDIKGGAHIVGKTIADMGYGNTPIDMIKFKSQDWNKNTYEGIILSNRNRSAQFVNLEDIAKSKNEKGITTNIGFVEHAGTPMQVLPMTGLIQLDDQDDYHIAAIRRDAETGNLQLISFLKNLYIRLDDYVSEYDQPGYKYDANQEQIKQTQNFILQDQGLNKYLKK